MRKASTIIISLGLAWSASAQSPKAPIGKAEFQRIPDPVPFAESIYPADFEAKMTVLCADSLAGRETGQIGQVRASHYIASQFEQMGLEKKGDDGSYYQYFTLERSTWNEMELEVRKKVYQFRKDWFSFANGMSGFDGKIKKVYFLPTVLAISDAVKGKAILMDARDDMDAHIIDLKNNGASAIFIIEENFEAAVQANRRALSGYGWEAVRSPQTKTPVVYLSKNAAQSVFGKSALKVQSAKKMLKIKTKIDLELKKNENILKGSNVLGYLEGSDPILKNEIIAITGHYDHLGESGGQIFYGADDNASGTTGVIEIAEAFVEAQKAGFGPKRSLLFMLVSGEEKGLLGSKYYTDFPIFPLENTITNLNTDMIGRIDDAHEGKGDYIYVIGANRLSKELQEINEAMNAKYTKVELDYSFDGPNDPNNFYQRSDHYNFAKNGIPVIFYFNGVHADYHKSTDTIEKIDFKAAAKRAQLTFYTAWELAHRAERPKLDK